MKRGNRNALKGVGQLLLHFRIMNIDEDYKESISEAEDNGFQVIGRVQVYIKSDDCFSNRTFYKIGGMPYLVGKPLGNMTILKVARRNGNLVDVISIGQKEIPVGNHSDEIDEYVTVNSKYIADLEEFYFKSF